MNKYKTYPEYKDSGVEWLGDIPSGWETKKLKYICDIKTGTKDTVNAVENGKYPFFVRSQTVERINSYTEDCEAILTAGDGVGVGKVYHYFTGKFDYHQRVYMLNNFKDITGKFCFYYLSSLFAKVALDGVAKSTVDSLRLPTFLNFSYSLPTIKEQEKIAAFLDYETGKIDELIEKQENLISLLEEKRQAVISHAVTKGLSALKAGRQTPMKDSGVEWLGETPKHWEVILFKRIIHQIKDGTHGTFKRVDKGRAFLSAKNVHNEGLRIDKSESMVSEKDFKEITANGFPIKGDLLLTCVGTIGRSCVYNFKYPFAFQRSVAFLRFKKNINPYYYNFVIKSKYYQSQLESIVKVSAQPGIYMGDLISTVTILPPLCEQEQIVEFLDEKTIKFDNLITKAKSAIELMKERRTALISAAVTGKIDVREFKNDVAELTS